MQGFQITFFTQQDRRHGSTPLAEWLLLEAQKLGLRGGTLMAAGEGFGHHGKLHSAHFFELADQPLGACRTWKSSAANRPQRSIFHRLLDP